MVEDNHLETPVTAVIRQDLAEGVFREVRTRFAPEPNAYLHIGHALSAYMTFGAARRFGGTYNLRLDDTNPAREKAEYVQAIREDLEWLGWDWEDREYYASDYFEQLYAWAVVLIRAGKAYVCDLSETEIAVYRGTSVFDETGRRRTPPGRPSPWRDRGVDENLDLFARMRAGEFSEGERTLRARIDMCADNLILRDPVMYRILKREHHRTGGAWCIYPTYDWAHGQSDSIEGITHSICAMEFRHHRALYDWYLDQLQIHHPRQVEYTRMKLTNTVTSKRHLVALMEMGALEGWDDPRLPTLRGLRRRGVPPVVIHELCAHVPMTEGQMNTTVELSVFEHILRDHLNRAAPRVMAVLDPLRLVIEDMAGPREIEVPNHPEDPSAGTRRLVFGSVLWIERDDFLETPRPGFRRLVPGGAVRLHYATAIRCREVVRDSEGRVCELRCRLAPDSACGRKTAILHWVSAEAALPAEVRLYEPLFTATDPLTGGGASLASRLNPSSRTILKDCRVEPTLAGAAEGFRCQFERKGYFVVDPDTRPGALVFNRIVSLRDGWERARKDLP